MARALIFLFLYGALSIVGTVLSGFWAKVAMRRLRTIDGKWRWFQDRYFILAASVTALAIGNTLVDVGRIFGNLFYGLSPILQRGEAWPIGIGMVFTLVGFLGAVWLADLERDPPSYRWLKVMAVLTLVWLGVAAFLAPEMPFYPLLPIDTPATKI